MKKILKLEKQECKGGCGYEITIIPRFKNMYCNKYCCGCCPEAKETPCQKERKFGSVSDNLAKSQLKKGEK